MKRIVCLFFFVLCQYGYGYPTKGDIEAGTPIQNASSFIMSSTSINKTSNANLTINPAILISHQHNGTTSNVSNADLTSDPAILMNSHQPNSSFYHEEMQGFAKKVVAKVKGGFNKVKTKVNVGIGKIKNKVTDIKNKIGGGGTGTKSGGGGGTGSKSGGGTGINYYRRPYNPHGGNTSSGGGGSGIHPSFLWAMLGLAVAGVLGTILYFMIKK